RAGRGCRRIPPHARSAPATQAVAPASSDSTAATGGASRPGRSRPMPPSPEQANQEMGDRLIAGGALWSPRPLAGLRATPRHCFLDHILHYDRKQQRWNDIPVRDPGPEELRLIYGDRALITRLSPAGPHEPRPISSSSQPSLMAQMLEDLFLVRGLSVLE